MNPPNPNTLRKSAYRRKVAWYTALKEPDPVKLTPHASEIMRAIQSYGRPATRAEVVAALAERIPNSKQKPTRVLSFHRKFLLAAGFIQIIKELAPMEPPGNKSGKIGQDSAKAPPQPQATAPFPAVFPSGQASAPPLLVGVS